MRKTKFLTVLLAVIMVLTMSVSAFAATSSSTTKSSTGTTTTKTTVGDVTAVDESGKTVEVTAKTLENTSETMKTVSAAGSAEKLIVDQSQKLAAAVALAGQSADLDDLKVASAMNVKVTASKENPVTVTIPLTAAELNGSVVVMEKTADGWTVVPATTGDGTVVATLTASGDVVVMVAPAAAEAPVDAAADVAEGAWYEKYENFAIIADIVEDDDVRPEEVTTRGDFLQMLFNMVGKPAAAQGNEFTDMEGYEAYQAAVDWAVENGICAGYGDNTVKCGKKITRQEMVMMLYNFAKYQKANTTDTTELTQYVDSVEVADWAQTAVKWANARGIVSGTSETTLSPASDSKRCQAVTVLYNYVVAQ